MHVSFLHQTVKRFIDAFLRAGLIITRIVTVPLNLKKVYHFSLTFLHAIRMICRLTHLVHGFDDNLGMPSYDNPGSFALYLNMWNVDHRCVIGLVVISNILQVGVIIISLLPSRTKLQVGQILLRYFEVASKIDRYEAGRQAGLFPINEAKDAMVQSETNGWCYSWKKSTEVDLEAKAREGEPEVRTKEWKIGNMIVSYEKRKFSAIIEKKAGNREQQLYVEWDPEDLTFAQRYAFLEAMEAWNDRPEQGILEDIRSSQDCTHSDLTRIIELVKKDYTVCKVKNVHNVITL
jgi:hypothetical protein